MSVLVNGEEENRKVWSEWKVATPLLYEAVDGVDVDERVVRWSYEPCHLNISPSSCEGHDASSASFNLNPRFNLWKRGQGRVISGGGQWGNDVEKWST
jgi:hypothetical protein